MNANLNAPYLPHQPHIKSLISINLSCETFLLNYKCMRIHTSIYKYIYIYHLYIIIRMEVASSRSDHPPTHYRLPKRPNFIYSSNRLFGGRAADAGNATPTFCFSVPAISKLTTLTVESLLPAPTETAKHHILAIVRRASNINNNLYIMSCKHYVYMYVCVVFIFMY